MQSNWLNEFQKWASIPCPDGEWVYRGQSAQCSEIFPKGMRNDYKSLFRSELYDISYGLAEKIFAESPIYGKTPLYSHNIDDSVGLYFQNMAYSILGGPPSSDPRLSSPEIIRALAQHYDYATLFIDVSLNPIVAALFASYRKEENSYVVNEDEDGIVFRWPARRNSNSRLVIGSNGDGSTTVNVIDISRISPYMRRPYNQCAALATPAHDPKPIYQPIHSPIDELRCVDMARLQCCDRFIIPSGGGSQLIQQNGVSMTAIFPDIIDLGYSYISVIALFSILSPPERIDHIYDRNGDKFWKKAFAIALAILDRECQRNIPGLNLPQAHISMSADKVRLELENIKETAHAAIEMMNSDDIQKQVEPIQRKYVEDIQAEHDRRQNAWNKALQSAIGSKKAKAKYAISKSHRHTKEWIRKEFDTRLQNVKTILETTGVAYDDILKNQSMAQKQWLECALYKNYLRR